MTKISKEELNNAIKYLVIALCVVIGSIIFVSCSKEVDTCKNCNTNTRIEATDGSRYEVSDKKTKECNDPQNENTRTEGTHLFIHPVTGDSARIKGTLIITKYCN